MKISQRSPFLYMATQKINFKEDPFYLIRNPIRTPTATFTEFDKMIQIILLILFPSPKLLLLKNIPSDVAKDPKEQNEMTNSKQNLCCGLNSITPYLYAKALSPDILKCYYLEKRPMKGTQRGQEAVRVICLSEKETWPDPPESTARSKERGLRED